MDNNDHAEIDELKSLINKLESEKTALFRDYEIKKATTQIMQTEIDKLKEESLSNQEQLRANADNFTSVQHELELAINSLEEKEREYLDRIKMEIARQQALEAELNSVKTETNIDRTTWRVDIEDLSGLNEEMEEKNKTLEIELAQKILENLLMSMPTNQKLLKLNKEYNGYGIIIESFLETNQEDETVKKYKILWKRNNISILKRNEILKGLGLENGVLTIEKLNGEKIKLQFDRMQKFDFEDLSQGYQNLKQAALRKKNIRTLEKLQEFCKLKKNTHNQASKVYASKNLWFILPSILITALSGIFSFLSSSSEIDTNTSVWLSITVGVLASISTFLQSFSGAMDFGGKTEGHSAATEEYDNILTVINFEISNPNESLQNTYSFYDKIKNEILQIKQKCKYQVPQDINNKYNTDQVNYQLQKIKADLMKDALELKADIVRNSLEGKTTYHEIDINKLEREFNVFYESGEKNSCQCPEIKYEGGTDEIV
ncbi:hypothetical protein CPAV1605_378 [seawater metagenome]|uniref:Uncharacterized protein n=1 Tax=seawater metagenome TaxID=1561972 RepID=A0A5E8CGW7_9ZZZZ